MPTVTAIPIDSDATLQRLSIERNLALNPNDIPVIRAYFLDDKVQSQRSKVGLADPTDVEWGQFRKRSASEATTLYAEVLEHMKLPVERCVLNGEWYTEVVPEEIARKYLGLKLHADLVGSYNAARPTEVIDQKKKMQKVQMRAQLPQRDETISAR